MSEQLPNLNALNMAAFVLDLDGVVTDTAGVHADSWKVLFDDYLREVSAKRGEPFVPFSLEGDYITYVDGRPRYEGVKAFLESRGIELPYGTPEDPVDMETICGLGNRKNQHFNTIIHRDGPTVFDTSADLIRHLKAKGVKTAIVSSSKNCQPVLEAAGLLDLFEVMVDGNYAAAEGLPGKPAPDTFVRACDLLGVKPEDSVAVEDAVSGVQACRAGGFKLTIGIDRGAGREALLEAGADVVVNDLGEFDID